MNVAELIEKLQVLDPHLEVVTKDEVSYYPVEEVEVDNLWPQGPFGSSFYYRDWPTDFDPILKAILHS